MPGVRGQAIQTGASPENVNAVEAGTADIAFALGDTAYIAYTEGTRLHAAPHRRLRSIAVLYTNASHFFVAPGSRIRSLSDLSGARVAYGVATVVPGRSRSLDLLLQAHGVDPATVTVRAALFADIVSGVTDGTIDVGVISAGYPVPAIEAGAHAGLRFLDVDPVAVERVRENHPFFLPLTIPPRTYSAQEAPIETVGVDNVLLCRADLDEELVYRLTKAFFEALPDSGGDPPIGRTHRRRPRAGHRHPAPRRRRPLLSRTRIAPVLNPHRVGTNHYSRASLALPSSPRRPPGPGQGPGTCPPSAFSGAASCRSPRRSLRVVSSSPFWPSSSPCQRRRSPRWWAPT